MNKNYYKFSDYHLEPGGFLKLDYIVNLIEENFKGQNIKILDVGCGSGNIALPLASLGYQVTAIDEDREAIEIVKKKKNFPNLFISNIKFEDYNCDSGYMNNESRIPNHESRITKFNLIIMSEFLEHATNPGKLLLKAREMLEDNGCLILTIPNGRSFEELIRRLFLSNALLAKLKKLLKKNLIKKEIQTPAQSPHLHFWSLKQIKKIITVNNLKILRIMTYASWLKGFFYVIGRFFIPRGSFVFKILNKKDNFFSRILPTRFGSNWIIVVQKHD